MSGGSWLRRAFVLGALVSIAFSALVVYAPNVLPPPVASAVREATRVDPQTALVFVGAAVGVVGLVSLWVWRAGSQSERLASRTTEEPERDARIAGEELTAAFEQRRAKTSRDVGATRDDGPLSDALREVLVEAYVHERGGREAAANYVDEGGWTTDRYAAAFVTAGDAIDYPLYFRLFAWLYPGEAYEYRANRALRAVEDACETSFLDYEAPERATGWRARLRSLRPAGGEDRSTGPLQGDGRSPGKRGD